MKERMDTKHIHATWLYFVNTAIHPSVLTPLRVCSAMIHSKQIDIVVNKRERETERMQFLKQ